MCIDRRQSTQLYGLPDEGVYLWHTMLPSVHRDIVVRVKNTTSEPIVI